MLVIDDEAVIRELVCLHLGLSGYECTAVPDGYSGLERARAEPFDLIVLDLLLPGLDGLSVCRAIRRQAVNSQASILMLTARREEADKVLGFESGADDYLTKPFGVRELVARAGALTRRSRSDAVATAPHPERGRIVAGGLSVDPDRRRVTVEGTPVDLTPQEFSLILTLASRPGIVFSRETLLAQVWRGEAFVSERSVDELVKRVRRKIQAAAEGRSPQDGSPGAADGRVPARWGRSAAAPGRRFIVTVWGTGYKFSDDL